MKISEIAGKKIAVWGMGAEGKDALSYLRNHGIAKQFILLNDTVCEKPAGFENCPLFTGDEIEVGCAEAEVIIRSPGVSIYKPELQKYRLKMTSVTDLCLNELRGRPGCRIIGISGSKGKSTSVSALAFMLEKLGYRVGLGGNIGRPLIELLDGEYDFVVAEISSYQASDLTVSPQIAMFTNLFYVHSEWHNGHENYCRDKIHLVANQKDGEVFFANARNQQLMDYTEKFAAHRRLYDIAGGFYAEGQRLYHNKDKLFDLSDLKLSGTHNLDNLAGVFSILDYLRLDVKVAAEALKEFEPLPHRLQKVAIKNNVLFINDSISTAPEAAIGAVNSFDGNLVLISGGQDNLQDYTDYARCIEANSKVKAVVTLFQTGPKIAKTLRENVKRDDFLLIEGDSLEKSVAFAYDLLQKVGGGTVLFTPTSPSFGFYKNFMERGNHFIQIVNALD
uniref:UDP-N-acetylmuramoylalanine--D-glutamate ligase n=1 Tax=uncultured Alphaproteobacteria bacterium TaxID=91750 RepID=A0A6G8F2H5_9PROT|nr:UDP-N-acetylmuramoylalanine--D-glutamate ligase [uncultured Alphaproteobacteria bacterium]